MQNSEENQVAVPQQPEIPPIQPSVFREWRSIKFYRFLVRVYMKILRIASTDMAQKTLIAISILGTHSLGITCFMITALNLRLPMQVDNVMQTIGFNILVLTILYFYSIKNLFDKEAQPICITIMIPLLTFSLMAENIALAILLDRYQFEISKKFVIFTIFLNFISIYYLFWIASVLVAGLMFIFEFLIRLVICQLTRPCNPHIKLPMIFYPILPAIISIDILIPEGNYIAAEHNIRDCVICLKVFEEGDSIKQLRCHPDHIFHTDCLHQWICIKLLCPICRAPIT